jgi:glutamate/tyrosine decarboxylase-like PLP-dependent enzyme
MSAHPIPDETAAALELAASYAGGYLGALPDSVVLPPRCDAALASLAGPLPEDGDGALRAIARLGDAADGAGLRCSGPRYFHFVTGGTTPAALGADWLASALDQNAAAWVCSPLAGQLEAVALTWLKELFHLPQDWQGVLTTGATMSNFTGLAAARRWWADRHGVDVDADGLAGLPQVPVLGSGYVHASVVKSLGMLGIGRSALQILTLDGTGRLDIEGLRGALGALHGAPAILVATAGATDDGAFDPIAQIADAAADYGAWLHVDGAFGMFAGLTPRTAGLLDGIDRADSVAADGHKWLNVPYDCGFAFVREPGSLGAIFTNSAPYLVEPGEPRPTFSNLGPENSRRARAFAVWATLAAYGRSGYRALVERHLDLAQQLAARIVAEADLELLAPVPLNVVCFRYHPSGEPVGRLDALNTELGNRVLEDGRVHVGTTVYDGHVCLRPTIVNWRTGPEHIDLLVDVLLELASAMPR